ncbi:unnamed protein product [Somion occarium]|uniref:Metallo-beta-lactamase domain-containing protein n=1 Tax=Somion occarium TaxID=3059160 RepID=A0ABP1CNK2_9APHY
MATNATSHNQSDDPVELIFLGTGTSSSLPHVDCLTAPPGAKPCRTCLSTLKPEGKKNIRRNTSVAMRIPGKDGKKITVIIDVGKSFQAAAVEWFPKYGLRRIDAVLITHAHADAMNGLDDLRGWTLRSSIQSHVDLYVSQATFKEVQRAFPYLVAKEYASGGGDVPEFKWHIIEDRVPFEIEDTGVFIKPFSVHHGRIFSTAPPVEFMPSPWSGSPTSTTASTPNPPGSPVHPGCHTPLQPGALAPTTDLTKPIQPYLCFGFVIQESVVYISDVSRIPEDVWNFLLPNTPTITHGTNGTNGLNGVNGPPVLVLDCLCLETHSSHLGFRDSVAYARRFDSQRTYLTGFGHEVSHEEYVILGEAVEGKFPPPNAELTENESKGLRLVGEGKQIWVRPAYDGLKVLVNKDGVARDEGYN